MIRLRLIFERLGVKTAVNLETVYNACCIQMMVSTP